MISVACIQWNPRIRIHSKPWSYISLEYVARLLVISDACNKFQAQQIPMTAQKS